MTEENPDDTCQCGHAREDHEEWRNECTATVISTHNGLPPYPHEDCMCDGFVDDDD